MPLVGAACSTSSARPLARSEWTDELDPPPEDVPWAVVVYQPRGSGTAVGTGIVVHDCAEHGTYVLTSFHLVRSSSDARVWMPDPERLVSDDDPAWHDRHEELVAVSAEIVFPPALPDDGDELEPEELDRIHFQRIVHLHTTDFAILRVEGGARAPAAPLHPGAEIDLEKGYPVELVATAPEGYPHRHSFEWSELYPREVRRTGHSGGAILLENTGRLFAMLSSAYPGTRRVWIRPSIGEMRELLHDAALDFVLDPAPDCD